MASIAIITARGGSKRIPKKNIKDFCGKPIIAYSIAAALKSQVFDEVMVSTDSTEISDIAKKYGAKVPFLRSEETSNDFATTADVLKEVLNEYEKLGKRFDTLCCIYPTAPFVTAEKLKNAMNILSDVSAAGVMPVVQYSFPPQRANIIKNGLLEYQYPEYRQTRSQDLEPIYHDAGQFYCYKVNEYLSLKTIQFAPIIVDDTEVQDIDTMSDWKIAEMKYRLMKESSEV